MRNTAHQRTTLPDAVTTRKSTVTRVAVGPTRPRLRAARQRCVERRGDGQYDRVVAILIDDPRWPAHGRLWAHLVSDSSLDELHEFAEANGIPRRGFDRDHYDVPEDAHARLIAAGARHVDGRTLVRALIASGLRVTARQRRLP